jgi:hypothetical protein
LAGALRLDGTIPLNPLGPEGVTQPGLAIRSDGNRVIEATWDGTTLSSTTIAEGYPIFDSFVLTQGAETWTLDGCRIQRGCSIAQCDPVRSCPGLALGHPIGVERDRLWSGFNFSGFANVSFGRLHLSQRPLDTGKGPTAFFDLIIEARASNMFNRLVMVERPLITMHDGFVLLPYLKAPGVIDFVALRDPGAAASVTEEWMVSNTGDPFTLLSTPMPSIP